MNPRPAFVDVNEHVADRSGLKAEWVRNSEDGARVEAAVTKLLEEELTADAAAQVALLNNRSLHATLEELGVSEAKHAQSRLLGNPELDAEAVPLAGGISEFSVLQNVLDLLVVPLRGKIGTAQLEQTKARVGGEMPGPPPLSHAQPALKSQPARVAPRPPRREDDPQGGSICGM